MALLQIRPEDQYLEATPVELPRATTSALEVVPGHEKEITFGDAALELPNFDSPCRASSVWRRWKLWLLLAAVVIAIVIAVAVYLGIRRAGSSRYAHV